MKRNSNPWKTLSSKTAFKNKWIEISGHRVIRPDKQEGEYFVVRKKPAVFTIALTPKLEVVLAGMWRYTTKQYCWEVPGGGTDGEPPLKAAKRELVEETGIKAKKWQKIGSFQSFNGVSDEISHTFIATGLTWTKENKQAEEGITEIKKVPFKKVLEMIKKGQITDGQTIAALTQAALYLKLI